MEVMYLNFLDEYRKNANYNKTVIDNSNTLANDRSDKQSMFEYMNKQCSYKYTFWIYSERVIPDGLARMSYPEKLFVLDDDDLEYLYRKYSDFVVKGMAYLTEKLKTNIK